MRVFTEDTGKTYTILQLINKIIKEGKVIESVDIVTQNKKFKFVFNLLDEGTIETDYVDIPEQELHITAGDNIVISGNKISVTDFPTFENIIVSNGISGLYVNTIGDCGLTYQVGDNECEIRIIQGVPEIKNKSENYQATLRVGTQDVEVQFKDFIHDITESITLKEIGLALQNKQNKLYVHNIDIQYILPHTQHNIHIYIKMILSTSIPFMIGAGIKNAMQMYYDNKLTAIIEDSNAQDKYIGDIVAGNDYFLTTGARILSGEGQFVEWYDSITFNNIQNITDSVVPL